MQKFPSTQILVIGPAWVGDMVMAQSLFKYLHFLYKDIAIDVVAPPWTAPLVQRMPEVRTMLPFPFKHGELKLIKRYLFAKNLRAQGYNQAIVLPHSLKSALVPFWAKIPKRTGWLGEYRMGLLNDVRVDLEAYPLMIQQFMALGLRKGELLTENLTPFYPKLEFSEQNRANTLEKLDLKFSSNQRLALCPGAEYGPSKRWPLEYFAAVANEKIQKGWEVYIFGSKKDAEIAARIMQLTSNKCHDLTGKTTLLEVIDLFSLMTAVICNDSGLMHIAAATNQTPVVVVYGSSSPKFTPPLSDNVAIINLNLECSPCFKRECPLEHFKCMKEVTPHYVISSLDSLLA